MCSCDVDEYPDVWQATYPKARKVHRCDECLKKSIKPGAKYKRISSLFDGSWSTWKICERCQRIREAHRKADPECNPPIEELLECVRENVRDPDYLAAFRKAWRESAAKAAA